MGEGGRAGGAWSDKRDMLMVYPNILIGQRTEGARKILTDFAVGIKPYKLLNFIQKSE